MARLTEIKLNFALNIISLLTVSILVGGQKLRAINKQKFIAAAYEHVPIPAKSICYKEVCKREDALSSMLENVEIYSEQTLAAKKLGAEMIVFPEFGIVPFVPRNQIRPFSERIPPNGESRDEWVPCDATVDSGIEVQKSLSCIAKENKMYVIANMVDYQPCDECNEDFCLYNTNILYDKNGRYAAKYHKFNLFNVEFPLFNIDKEAQNVYADTELGRLGLIVCEDLLWYYPTDDLVYSSQVDTVLFSTYWTDVYPYFLSHANQASRAKALQVNFIGSNIHGPLPQNTGSGVYTTEGAINYYHNVSQNAGGKLVVGELPIHPNKLFIPIQWNQYVNENGADYPFGGTQFQTLIHGDLFKMVEMDPEQKRVKICSSGNDNLCCVTKYNYSRTDIDGTFSLGVFKGIYHKNESVRGVMVNSLCVIVKCNSETPNLCDSEDYWHSGMSQTYFTTLELSGNFEPATSVYPQSVFTEFQLRPELEKVLPDGRMILNLANEGANNAPFVSMTLFGRRPQDDGPPPENWCPHEDLY